MAFTYIENVMFDTYITRLSNFPTTKTGFYKIPTSVKVIGIQAFSRCAGLLSIQLPAGLERIEMLAFEDCKHITTIKIPRTVNHIGQSAFKGCTAIVNIYVQHSIPLELIADANIFEGVNRNKCILFVPRESRFRYQQAPVWRDFKDIVEFAPEKIVEKEVMIEVKMG